MNLDDIDVEQAKKSLLHILIGLGTGALTALLMGGLLGSYPTTNESKVWNAFWTLFVFILAMHAILFITMLAKSKQVKLLLYTAFLNLLSIPLAIYTVNAYSARPEGFYGELWMLKATRILGIYALVLLVLIVLLFNHKTFALVLSFALSFYLLGNYVYERWPSVYKPHEMGFSSLAELDTFMDGYFVTPKYIPFFVYEPNGRLVKSSIGQIREEYISYGYLTSGQYPEFAGGYSVQMINEYFDNEYRDTLHVSVEWTTQKSNDKTTARIITSGDEVITHRGITYQVTLQLIEDSTYPDAIMYLYDIDANFEYNGIAYEYSIRFWSNEHYGEYSYCNQFYHLYSEERMVPELHRMINTMIDCLVDG